MKRFPVVLATSLVLALIAGAALAQYSTDKKEAKASKAAKTALSLFLIESPHTEEECLGALDEVKVKGTKELAKWSWGCMAGNHTGYCMTEAADEAAALAMVPSNVREKATAHKLTKFTAEQIASFHKK